jgi:ribonuclease P protein component
LFLSVNDLPGPPIRILISVSKRYVRKAVKRNRLKRQIREIIRLHQRILQDGVKDRKDTLLVAVLFAGKEMPDYTLMERKIIQILTRLSQLDEKTT